MRKHLRTGDEAESTWIRSPERKRRVIDTGREPSPSGTRGCCTRQRNDLSIRSALHAERSNVSCFVTELFQELDSLRRDSGVGQEPHG